MLPCRPELVVDKECRRRPNKKFRKEYNAHRRHDSQTILRNFSKEYNAHNEIADDGQNVSINSARRDYWD